MIYYDAHYNINFSFKLIMNVTPDNNFTVLIYFGEL